MNVHDKVAHGRIAAPSSHARAPVRHVSLRSARSFIVAAVLAALAPFLSPIPKPAVSHAGFPGWPSTFEERPVREIALAPVEQRFAADFPGRIGRFSDGQREVVMRWIAAPTRKLHAAADCFKGSGYRVKPLPLKAEDGKIWGAFSAERGERRLHVREVITDSRGSRWTDVSAWYWAAIRGETQPPWLAVTVAASDASQLMTSAVPLAGAD